MSASIIKPTCTHAVIGCVSGTVDLTVICHIALHSTKQRLQQGMVSACWEAHGLRTPPSTSPSPPLPDISPTTTFQKINQLSHPNRKTTLLKGKKRKPKHFSLTASLKK